MPEGRPSDYTIELALTICEEIASGRSLRSLCAQEDMPGQRTVFTWLHKHDEFRQHYTRAREAQADAMLEEILLIADDGTGDTWIDDEGVERTNQDVISRSRLRVDARKWAMSKMAPKKYGEKVEHSGDPDNPIHHVIERRIVDTGS